MEDIKGRIERVTYNNPENGFSVIRLKREGESELTTVVGNLGIVNPGAHLSLRGHWKNDPKFGRQFSAESFKEELPSTLTGIEKYLGSGLIKGIGPVYAKKMVILLKWY